MNPDISVLMPVWNGCSNGKEPYLRLAIESILNQTFKNFEFIIVNDGSTDNTFQVISEYKDERIKIVNLHSNLKIVKALNTGLNICSGNLIARMDSDDISTVTRLEIQKDFLDNRPETVMCGTGMYVINEEGKLVMEIYHPCNYSVVKEFMKKGCPFVHGSVMFRKDTIKELGGYSTNPDFEYAEDYELWVRMAKKHVVENIPERILYFHRNHKTKSSSVFSKKQDESTKKVMELARI